MNLDKHLQDRFVCGVNTKRIQQKLLSMKTLTLKTALEHAIAMEAAHRDMKQIQHGGNISSTSCEEPIQVNCNYSNLSSKHECFRWGY